MLYNFVQTDEAFYFRNVCELLRTTPFCLPIGSNLRTVLDFARLPLHLFVHSRLDVIVAIFVLLMLILGRKSISQSFCG